MDQLEALLARDYEIRGRRSWWRAAICFKHLRQHFDRFPIDQAYEASSRYILARRSRGAAPATVRNELAALGSALAAAARAGMIAKRPALALPAVGNRNARTGFFRDGDLEQLVASLPDPIDDLVRFAYLTGFRRGEVFRLEWSQVDWSAGTVWIPPNTTKSGDARLWPFYRHPGLHRVLERREIVKRGPYVFHRDGKCVRDLRGAWKRACAESGVGRRLFHDLRRSAARNMVLAGVPTQIILKLLGWKSEAMLRRYGIFDELDLAHGVGIYARGNGREKDGEASHDRL